MYELLTRTVEITIMGSHGKELLVVALDISSYWRYSSHAIYYIPLNPVSRSSQSAGEACVLRNSERFLTTSVGQVAWASVNVKANAMVFLSPTLDVTSNTIGLNVLDSRTEPG